MNYIIFTFLAIPMFTTLAVCYHILPRFMHEAKPVPEGIPLYECSVLKCENNTAVVQFRIEAERKTVVQTCPTERNYIRGEKIGIYFLDDGKSIFAVLRENRHFDIGYLISGGVGLIALIVGVMSVAGMIVCSINS